MRIWDLFPNATGVVACLQPDCSVHIIDVSELNIEEHDVSDIQYRTGVALYKGFEAIGRKFFHEIDLAYEQIGVAAKPMSPDAQDSAVTIVLGEVAIGAIADGRALCSPWGFLAHEIAGTVQEIMTDDWEEDETPAYEE